MLKEIVEAITDKNNSVDLKTSKSPVQTVTVLKYSSGGFGILNYSMDPAQRQFLMDNGYKDDRNTHYPYKSFKDLKSTEAELKKLFGIRNGLTELEFRKTMK